MFSRTEKKKKTQGVHERRKTKEIFLPRVNKFVREKLFLIFHEGGKREGGSFL